jgi:hypothetical protein
MDWMCYAAWALLVISMMAWGVKAVVTLSRDLGW